MTYNVSFCGGETCGSVGKRDLQVTRKQDLPIQTPQGDILTFKGKDNDSSGFGKALLLTAGATALIIGGVGYAHKNDLVGKLKNGKFKKFLKKHDIVGDFCYKICKKVKDIGIKGIEKIKNTISKK